MSCTHVGTTSWPSVAFTSATASTTACDRLSRLERPLASVIPGRVDPAGSRASDANARREESGANAEARTPEGSATPREASEAKIDAARRIVAARDGVQTPETRAPRGKAIGAAGTFSKNIAESSSYNVRSATNTRPQPVA